jgi:hypothetical protein
MCSVKQVVILLSFKAVHLLLASGNLSHAKEKQCQADDCYDEQGPDTEKTCC